MQGSKLVTLVSVTLEFARAVAVSRWRDHRMRLLSGKEVVLLTKDRGDRAQRTSVGCWKTLAADGTALKPTG